MHRDTWPLNDAKQQLSKGEREGDVYTMLTTPSTGHVSQYTALASVLIAAEQKVREGRIGVEFKRRFSTTTAGLLAAQNGRRKQSAKEEEKDHFGRC